MIDIRPARADDIVPIVALMRAEGMCLQDLNYEYLSPPVLVAVTDGRIVGVISALLGQPVAYMATLVVDSSAHLGRGRIGELLIHCMETWLRALGCTAWAAFFVDGGDLQHLLPHWPGAIGREKGQQWVKAL